MAAVIALPASGRLRVIQATPSSIWRQDRLVAGRPPARGHQLRWMMFIREVQTGSPLSCSRQAVSTTTKVMVLPLDSLR